MIILPFLSSSRKQKWAVFARCCFSVVVLFLNKNRETDDEKQNRFVKNFGAKDLKHWSKEKNTKRNYARANDVLIVIKLYGGGDI